MKTGRLTFAFLAGITIALSAIAAESFQQGDSLQVDTMGSLNYVDSQSVGQTLLMRIPSRGCLLISRTMKAEQKGTLTIVPRRLTCTGLTKAIDGQLGALTVTVPTTMKYVAFPVTQTFTL